MKQEYLDNANNLASIIVHAMANGWTTDLKVAYVKQVLPKHYEVKESKQKGNVHCKSCIGIDDEEQWNYFMSALKGRFDNDFSEVFHNTCFNHVDFTIYFKQQ